MTKSIEEKIGKSIDVGEGKLRKAKIRKFTVKVLNESAVRAK